MRRDLLLLATALVTSASALTAQPVPGPADTGGTTAPAFPTELQAGVRVRLWLPEPRRQWEASPAERLVLRGTVASATTDTLRLAVPGIPALVPVPRTSVRRVDVSRGAPSRAVSAVERAAQFALVMAATAPIFYHEGGNGLHGRDGWDAAPIAAAYGAGCGFLVGAIWPTERWKRIRLRP